MIRSLEWYAQKSEIRPKEMEDHCPQYWLDLVSACNSLPEQRRLLTEATTRFHKFMIDNRLSIERYRNDNTLLQIWLKFIDVER